LKQYNIEHDITGVVLAGGKNSRFKSEKSLIEIDDQCLIELEINVLKSIFKEIIIVSEKEEIRNMFPDIIFANDFHKDCGPLAGLHAALKKCTTQGVFLVACDMPNLNKQFILRQLSLLQDNANTLAIVPRHGNGFEPLHSFYHKNCLPFVEALLAQKKYSVRGFFDKISIKWYEASAEEEHFYYNVNTQHDLAKYINNKAK